MKYYKEYQEWLDEIQPLNNGFSYAVLLERGDPIAFNCGYDDYLNANNIDEDDEENTESEDQVYIETLNGPEIRDNGKNYK